jgi:2'-5' RNA ligase superfamily
VAGYVHDAWFDVREVRQDGDVVSIPLALRGIRVKKRFRLAHIELPEYESKLAIRGVSGFEVDEPEQIAAYRINDLTFDPPRLTILAEPSCTVTIEASELDVAAELNMNRYDWNAPGATALVVPLRAADPVIGDLRRAHTPSGREGMPAHSTVLAPFIHASRLDSLDRRRLSDAIGRFPAFDLRLSSFGLFDDIGCLWLAPHPRRPFAELTEALLDIYPEVDYPPAGADEIVPHVTIGGRLSEEQQEKIKRAVGPHLPIRARADRVALFERGAGGRWSDRYRFRLKA